MPKRSPPKPEKGLEQKLALLKISSEIQGQGFEVRNETVRLYGRDQTQCLRIDLDKESGLALRLTVASVIDVTVSDGIVSLWHKQWPPHATDLATAWVLGYLAGYKDK